MPQEPVHLTVITCVWRRPHLTRATLKYYERAAQTLASEDIVLTGAATGSEGERSRAICEEAGFLYDECPNRPLSNKLNRAVELAREGDPDGLLMVGSDDWLSHDLLRAYAKLARRGRDYVRLRDLYILDGRSRACGHFRGPTGVGTMLLRDVVERMNWQLWPAGMNMRLDGGMYKRLRGKVRHAAAVMLAKIGPTAVALDVKTSTNLRSYRSLPRRGATVCDAESVLCHFDEPDREALEQAIQQECGLPT